MILIWANCWLFDFPTKLKAFEQSFDVWHNDFVASKFLSESFFLDELVAVVFVVVFVVFVVFVVVVGGKFSIFFRLVFKIEGNVRFCFCCLFSRNEDLESFSERKGFF